MDTLQIIFDITLAFITIDITVYAIANSLLGKQLLKNLFIIKRRLEEVNDEIDNLRNAGGKTEDDLKEINNRIADFTKDKIKLEKTINSLKLEGAVIKPAIAFCITLIIISLTNYILNSMSIEFNNLNLNYVIVIIALIPLIYGINQLYYTLKYIEYASTNILLPDINVYFYNGEKTIQLKKDESNFITINLHNKGYEIAELVTFELFFPNNFTIEAGIGYVIEIQQPKTPHQGYIGVIFEMTDIIHVTQVAKYDIVIKTPNITGKIQIPYELREKISPPIGGHLEIEITN
jgi:hypothetical protein